MKKYFYLLFLLSFISCKKNSITEEVNPVNQSSSDTELTKDLNWLVNIIDENINIDSKKALFYCSELIQISQKLNNKSSEALGYYKTAFIYDQKLNMYVNALSNYFSGLDIWKEQNNNQAISNTYLGIGSIYFKVGLYDDALKYYQLLLGNAQKVGNKKDEATAYKSLALTYRELHTDESTVISFYEKALQIRIALNDEVRVADCYNGLANTYLLNKDYQKAKNYYSQALSIYSKNEGIELVDVYFNLGLVHGKLKDLKTKMSYLLSALDLAKKINYQAALIDINLQLGNTYQEQGDYVQAIDKLNQAEVIAKELHDNASLIEISNLLSTCYTAIGNTNKAEEYDQQSENTETDYTQEQIKAIAIQNQQYSEVKQFNQGSILINKKNGSKEVLWIIGILIGLVTGAGITFFGAKRRVVEKPMIKLRKPELADLSWWHTNQFKWIIEELDKTKKIIDGLEMIMQESSDEPTREVVQLMIEELREKLKTIRYLATLTDEVNPTDPPTRPS